MSKGARLDWGISQSWVNWHFLKTMCCYVLIFYLCGVGTAGVILPTRLAGQAGMETGPVPYSASVLARNRLVGGWVSDGLR